ncbi:heterokaryon incompatibility 6 OR allele [Fusarium mundagurra]|uniref:Heterokaryon incompatibility 6 OR allele n=1 Tax=Fusarium mundagurra TaxID=1567541 RepID=A0A8H5YP59_9HYPO|nr:heterokaryon incompatibility 6 OR allele [Fusarium mundagurra]
MTEKLDHGPKVMSVNGEVCATIYKPLDNNRQEIRLLTLLPPRDGDANIYCTLSHAVLNTSSENPKYEALSYVWGEPDFSEPIILNNHTFFITPSLKYILSCLRQRDDQPRVLWVDAICINQSDVEERGHQVALMREIYSNCQRDIAWLDPMIGKKGVKARDLYNHPDLDQEENWVRCGMELMREIAEKNPQTLKELQDQAREGGYRLVTGSQLALGAVFRQPTLWSRLWVMQELSLAPRLTLMSRDAELSWDVLKNLFKDEPYFDAFHMGRESSHSLEYYKDFSEVFVPIKLIEDQRRLMTQGKGSKLMDVLVRFREMESTDPRDKIFGLLGLVTEEHGINVDYMTSVPQLYQQATASLINLTANLDILCQNPFERPKGPTALDGQRKLPSWVAEYDSKRRQCATMLFAQRGIFNAGIKNCETPCRLIGPKKDILVTKGTILGTIAPILQDDKDPEARDVMNLYLGKGALEKPQEHLYAPKVGGKEISTGDTAIRAFWRTMVKDCTLPPRMRRLRPTEIERLDVENQEQLKTEWSPLQTYRLHFGNKYSRSAFGYQPADDEDLAKLDIEGQISHHYSPGSFMFAATDNGLFLATRFAAKQGDVVAVLDGGKVPLALRKAESRDGAEGELYMVVGSTYVHGFMDGEAEAGVTEGWLEKREILIA